MPGRPDFGRRADGAPSYARGAKWPAWAVLVLPFLLQMLFLNRLVKSRVRWTACWLTVLVFEAVLLPVEHKAILNGLWVYNSNRILGPLFWGIPIEEPLIYYLFPPVLAIMLFEFIHGTLQGTIRFDLKRELDRGLKVLGWKPPVIYARRTR